MMMTKQKTSLAERLNIGDEVRELKIGCTFNPKNTTTSFHTIKYDFKPASVDTNRVATVDVGSNNQVTVTVPNLVSSGVPHTVYKGNHRKYTKECLVIYDRKTGDITLEKLNHNIQVKKTRSEMTNKPCVVPSTMAATNMTSANATNNATAAGAIVANNVGIANAITTAIASGGGGGVAVPTATAAAIRPNLENSTMRISSKTKVSTGSRRNNIIDFKPRNSPMQGSPSAPPSIHKSPQSAPAWHANNAQATLPSIPMIDDDDSMFGMGPAATAASAAYAVSNNAANISTSSSSTASSLNNSMQEYQFPTTQQQRQPKTKQAKQSHYNNQQKRQQQQSPVQQQQQPQNHYQQQQLPPQHQSSNRLYHNSTNGMSNIYAGSNCQNNLSNSLHLSSHSGNSRQQLNSGNSIQNHPPGMESPHDIASQSLANAAAALEQQIGVLSSSSSSSDSESSASDSGSDSDNSSDEERHLHHQQQPHQHQPLQQHQQPQQMHQLPNLGMGPLSLSPPLAASQQTHLQPSHQMLQNNQSHNHHSQHQQKPHLHHHQQHQQLQQSSGYASNGAFPNDLLQNDLQLSSNSSDDDDD